LPGGAGAPTEKDPARSVASDLSAGKRFALRASFYFAGPKSRASTQEKGAPTCRGATKTRDGWAAHCQGIVPGTIYRAPTAERQNRRRDASATKTRDGWAAYCQEGLPGTTDLPGSPISRAPLAEASGALLFRRPGGPSRSSNNAAGFPSRARGTFARFSVNRRDDSVRDGGKVQRRKRRLEAGATNTGGGMTT